jgi:aminopeptidase-like protein
MNLTDLQRIFAEQSTGHEMRDMIAALYPICRSITGEGFRKTLCEIRQYLPLEIREVPSGTPVFDWTVPLEWNIRDAYIAAPDGTKVVDFQRCNLHVMSYSVPVKARMRLEELRRHLHSLPDRPEWVPYRTSYYKENWGFCLSHRQLKELADTDYDVCIDSSLEPGHLTYGECLLPGQSAEEILISVHCCHPSLCNDNLSGIAVATHLGRALQNMPRKFSYRFLFIPGTIGSITWLATNQDRIDRIRHGLVLTGVGDAGGITYKRSRKGDTLIDRAMAHVLHHQAEPYKIIDFFPYGYDERQYCSPGFNLPVGCLMRTPHGEYPEYHTSADNLEFVLEESMRKVLILSLRTFFVLENDRRPISMNPKCEPQLGKRGLYRAIAGQTEGALKEMALLWVLNLADGRHSLLDIADRAQMSFESVYSAACALSDHGLLRAEDAATLDSRRSS